MSRDGFFMSRDGSGWLFPDEPPEARSEDRSWPGGSVRPLLPGMPRPARVPLSHGQWGVWLLNRLGGGSLAVTWVAVRFSGELDRVALQAALADVAVRHESLRTVFPDADGIPWQQVLDPEQGRPVLAVTQAAGQDVGMLAAGLAGRGFDLAVGLP